MTASHAWYRFVLRRYPRHFRDRFSGEILEVIDAQRRALGNAPILRVVVFHVATTADLITALARERWHGTRRVAGSLLIVAAGAHLGYDLLNPTLAMGIPAWAVTLIAIVAGVLMSGPPTRSRRAT